MNFIFYCGSVSSDLETIARDYKLELPGMQYIDESRVKDILSNGLTLISSVVAVLLCVILCLCLTWLTPCFASLMMRIKTIISRSTEPTNQPANQPATNTPLRQYGTSSDGTY